MNGFLLLDKEKGISSHDLVYKARKALNTKKIGHAGTLDPLASGLMILGVNAGTRLLEFIVSQDKVYKVEMELGKRSDTYDCEGIIENNWEGKKDPKEIDKLDIKKSIESFLGEIDQIPPRFSAIKIDGEKAYNLARQGKSFEIPSRKINIYKISDIEIKDSFISFEVHCSKGTYIRTLVFDIGEILGCGALMTNLRRTKIGDLDLNSAVLSSEITEDVLLPLISDNFSIFQNLDKYEASLEEFENLKNGRGIKVQKQFKNKNIAVYYKDQLVCISIFEEIEMKLMPKKVLTFTI